LLTYGFAATTTYVERGDGTLVSEHPYGTLTLNTKTGAYSFTADPDKIDALKGETIEASFSVAVTDEHGAASDPETIVFNIVGANDTAEISGSKTGSVTEDGTLSASGELVVADRDTGESSFQIQMPDTLVGLYGDFTFDAKSGEWAYLLRNGDANVQGLTAGQLVHDELVVTSLDGSATETIRVAINGVDEPVPPADDPALSFKITRTQVDIEPGEPIKFEKGIAVITNFTNNDILTWSQNGDFTEKTFVDYDNNAENGAESGKFSFSFKGEGNAKATTVDIIIVGGAAAYVDASGTAIVL
jgi:VCBS repeat-containing protein